MITTAAPRLRIRRPSPTAAEFTVTTLPPPTLALRLLGALLLALRLGLALATLLLLRARWTTCPLAAPRPASPRAPPPSPLSADALWWALDAWDRAPAGGEALARLASRAPLPLLLAGAAAALYLVGLRAHRSESLLVLRGLGVQTTESAGTWFSGAATRFIPTEKIQDILVNEAFRRFEVRYYLVVVVEGEEDVVVVFPGLLPRRGIVEAVWRGARECLYEGRAEDSSKGQSV
ncbi:hypothetical protein JDV02_005994 [Purpureocillium takamizusanense]|uniref:Phosphatidylinositol N-acetylglucosaminyltransferase subunit H conserved domain-containing protein n=1 Tax=Purpureocillium takamizusanense TaxID=2060973 RepID=A0A9Q8VCI7_9HYPO|nr:uncharacterized protein JDV02_005994 [Purpureocillium takamizusanense]UNI19847.1 hypothetical protein JDV02_005994 [Purpureocillium takamizusanense]